MKEAVNRRLLFIAVDKIVELLIKDVLLMTEPVTAAVVLGLAVSKFAETGAAKTAEKLVEGLWTKLKAHFEGRKKAKEALEQLEAAKGEAPEAEAGLVRVIDGELFEDEDFKQEIEAIVKAIREAEPELEAKVSIVINSSGANAVNTGENKGTINYGKV